MANETYGRTYKIDTASSVTVIHAGPFYVKSIKWVALTANSGDRCVVTDTDDKTIWEDSANGANYNKGELLEQWWNSGFKVPTLGNGTLYVTT